jgi:hypothetical protein
VISRNLSRRIERLERQLRPRIKKMTASDIDLFQRLYDLKKRSGEPGWEAFAPPSSTLLKSPRITKESLNIEMIQRLHAGRTRNHENELARQTAAATAAKEEIEITEA